MDPIINQAPVSAPNESNRSLVIIIIVIVLIVLAVVIAVSLRNAGVKVPGLPQGDSATTEGELTEEEKAELLASLSAGATSTPLTETEKQQMLDSLSGSSEDVKPLTEFEKQQLLKSLE